MNDAVESDCGAATATFNAKEKKERKVLPRGGKKPSAGRGRGKRKPSHNFSREKENGLFKTNMIHGQFAFKDIVQNSFFTREKRDRISP